MNLALMRKYEMCPYNQKDKVNYNKDLTISILKEEQYARDIANYIILNNAHLNKEHIGEIISNGNIKLNINILMHYLNEFDFKENYLIKALSELIVDSDILHLSVFISSISFIIVFLSFIVNFFMSC